MKILNSHLFHNRNTHILAKYTGQKNNPEIFIKTPKGEIITEFREERNELIKNIWTTATQNNIAKKNEKYTEKITAEGNEIICIQVQERETLATIIKKVTGDEKLNWNTKISRENKDGSFSKPVSLLNFKQKIFQGDYVYKNENNIVIISKNKPDFLSQIKEDKNNNVSREKNKPKSSWVKIKQGDTVSEKIKTVTGEENLNWNTKISQENKDGSLSESVSLLNLEQIIQPGDYLYQNENGKVIVSKNAPDFIIEKEYEEELNNIVNSFIKEYNNQTFKNYKQMLFFTETYKDLDFDVDVNIYNIFVQDEQTKKTISVYDSENLNKIQILINYLNKNKDKIIAEIKKAEIKKAEIKKAEIKKAEIKKEVKQKEPYIVPFPSDFSM